MRVLITGGLGVIGSQCAIEFISNGHTVTILDACEEPRNEWIANNFPKTTVIRKERLENADLSDIDGYDLIMHAAAYTGIPSSAENSDDDWVSNVDATKNLIDQAKRFKKCPTIVALSSVKPYKIDHIPVIKDGERYVWEDGITVDENFPTDPDEPYAASKLAQSALCIAQARTFNLPLTVFRCSNLYGPSPCHGPRHGWLTWFCISAAIGRPLVVQGDGFQSRDMLHSSDVFSAVMTAHKSIGTVQGKLFNLGGGLNNLISIGEAASILKKLGAEIVTGPGRKFEDKTFITNTSLFTRHTGWIPKMNVMEEIFNVYKWALNNKSELNDIYRNV